MIKTRKIQLLPLSPFKDTYDYLRNIENNLVSISNEAIRHFIIALTKLSESANGKKLTANEKKKFFDDNYGMSLQNIGYDISKKYSEDVPSNIRTTNNQLIFKLINDKQWEIFNNRISIPSFKKNKYPISFSYKDNIKMIENDYVFSFFNNYKFKLHFGKDRSNNKLIINRILSGEYKPCASKISIIDDKIFLLLTYEFNPISKTIGNKIIGVDLGINRPLTFAREDGHPVHQINIGGKIEMTRLALKKQRYSLQSALKYSKGGHGITKKTKKLEDLRKKEENIMKNLNNQISRALINYAKDHEIGLIRMEDLTGITDKTKNSFLKSWAYFQLQTMIQDKAKDYFIIVEYVDPAYTSQTCSTCGNLDKEQRNGVKFICSNKECLDFGEEKDADINAATNISKKPGSLEKKKSKKVVIIKES